MSQSDGSAVTQRIMATHYPDGNKEFNLDPFLRVVDNIIHQPTFPCPNTVTNNETGAQSGLLRDDYTFQNGFGVMSEDMVYIVNRVHAEISTKSLAGGDVHEITLEVFKLVPGYAWENKVVISLAAYIVKYSEYWLVAQSHQTRSSRLANSLAILMSLPNMMEPQQREDLRLKFEKLTKLIEIVLDLTKTIGEIKKVPPTEDLSTLNEIVATTAYWCIYTTVVCFSQITGIQCSLRRYISSSTDDAELCEFIDKMDSIRRQTQEKIDLSYENTAYRDFVKRLFDAPGNDNIKILTALIYAKDDDEMPLLDCCTKSRVCIDVLRRKYVLLLISDLDLFQEEVFILDQMYIESRQRTKIQYEVVWLPVVDRSAASWNEEKESQFQFIRSSMPWYSVNFSPSLLDPAVIKYIKEVWHFKKRPLLVALDPQGNVVNPNAINMMRIWGNLAFPFTSQREEALWREEAWKIEFLTGWIDPLICNWVEEKKYICLYGGEDIEWIRRFITTARDTARAAHIPLEMVYVGKSESREKVRKNNETIVVENLSHVLPDMFHIWFFWVRLESMLYSKMQHGGSLENDPILRETIIILSFDGSDQGWAAIWGPDEMTRAKGDTMLQSLTKFDLWGDRVGEVGFVPALDENLQALHTPHHCNRLIFSDSDGSNPERVVCGDCGSPMEKYVMYRCCTD